MGAMNLSNEELVNETKAAVASERTAAAEVIRLFQEIAARKLFLDYGYPTLFEMVTKHFGYCAASAHRRIQSARLINDLPEVEAKIESGELSLTAASQLQSFFYRDASDYSRAERIELVETCMNRSTRDIERELCRRNPEREKRETVRAVSENRLRVSFSISAELNDKIDHLKSLLSHAEANLTTEHLLERLVELGLDRHDPKRKAARAESRSAKRATNKIDAIHPKADCESYQSTESSYESPTTKINDQSAILASSLPAPEVRTRYVPASEKHKVARAYDGGGCEFIHEASGRRCGSKHFLQLDHIDSFSTGGENTADNLQMFCGAHNRLKWHRGCSVRETAVAYVS